MFSSGLGRLLGAPKIMPDEDIETWDEAAVVKAIDQARGLMSKVTWYRSPLFSWGEAKSSHRDTCKDNQQRKRAITMTARTQKGRLDLVIWLCLNSRPQG